MAGVDALIVHARKAWLKGLSPREKSRSAATRLCARSPAESGVSGACDRVKRRHCDCRSGTSRAWCLRWRDDEAGGISGAVAVA
jgi:hypothetical protein